MLHAKWFQWSNNSASWLDNTYICLYNSGSLCSDHYSPCPRWWRCDTGAVMWEDVTTHRNVTTDNRHSALGTGLLTSQQCRTRLQNLPARIANILVRSSRQILQHSNMILRSESRRAVLVSSSIKATSHNISLERAPNVNSSWWQVWASVLVIWSGLCWGEELMVSINTIIRTLLRQGRGFYSRGSLGAYRWVNASNH